MILSEAARKLLAKHDIPSDESTFMAIISQLDPAIYFELVQQRANEERDAWIHRSKPSPPSITEPEYTYSLDKISNLRLPPIQKGTTGSGNQDSSDIPPFLNGTPSLHTQSTSPIRISTEVTQPVSRSLPPFLQGRFSGIIFDQPASPPSSVSGEISLDFPPNQKDQFDIEDFQAIKRQK